MNYRPECTPPPAALVERVVAELAPLMLRERSAMARHGCLRDVSSTHLHVLMLLESEGPLTMSRLADALDVSLPTATGLVSRMEERGFVARVHDDHDRRRVEVRLAEAGRRALADIDLVRREHVAWLIAQLSPDAQERVLSAFRELREAVERTRPADEPSFATHQHPHARARRTGSTVTAPATAGGPSRP